jgi:hypothetical protein
VEITKQTGTGGNLRGHEEIWKDRVDDFQPNKTCFPAGNLMPGNLAEKILMAMTGGMDGHACCIDSQIIEISAILPLGGHEWIIPVEGAKMHVTRINMRAHACSRITIDVHA